MTQKNQLSEAISWAPINNKQWANKKSRLNINFTHLYALVKARKTRLENLGTTSWKHVKMCFAEFIPIHRVTCLRVLPSATSVVKFLLGRSLHPENSLMKPNRCSEKLSFEKIFLEGTGLRKIRQRFLSEVCAKGMCVAIHSNYKCQVLCHLSCLVLREIPPA